MTSRLIIGSRGSRLALAQSLWVSEQLTRLHPGLDVSVLAVRTTGDKNLGASLAELGGKGAFTKELEDALLDRRCDLAVHSLKDLPTTLPEGLRILCTPPREDTRDLAIVREAGPGEGERPLSYISDGATVGTSSLRRRALLARLRPDLRVVEFRGNVDTRLRKLRDGEVIACILAAAGIKRLGLLYKEQMLVEGLRAHWLEPPTWLPAVGQGALAIEGRADDDATAALLAPLHDAGTFAATSAERGLLNALGAGCAAPVGALALVPQGSSVYLHGFVLSHDGRTIVEGKETGAISDAAECGRTLAGRLIREGADKLL